MSVGFYADHNIDGSIVRELRLRGVDVVRLIDHGLHLAEDEVVLMHASTAGRVLVTEDQDFLRLADRFMREGRYFAGVIFISQRGWHRGRIVEELTDLALAGDPPDFAGGVVYLTY